MKAAPSETSHERLHNSSHRLSRSLPLWICSDTMDSFRTELINISPSGLYCRVPSYIHPYSKLMVTFDLPFVSGDSATVECEGIVTRIEPGVDIPGIQEHRLAIDFCNLDHETTCLLHDFLEEPATACRDKKGMLVVPGMDRLSAHFGCAVPDVSRQMIMNQHTARMDRLAIIGELAEGLAPEIMNPLACIASTVQVIADEADSGEAMKEIHRELLKQVNQLDGTLAHLLQCAYPNKPSYAPLKLENIIDRTLLLLADRIQAKKTRLDVRHGFDQPFIQGDEVMLQQAFHNIFLNALEAMPDGTLTIQTCWSFRAAACAKKECLDSATPRTDAGIIVAIKDTGCGIDPAALIRIFNPFYTTKSNRKGLGLSIAHRIIEQHYGNIYVESKPGTGSTFLVCLPTAQGEGEYYE
jgi:nitrogen-specific signal transduction histidine kinase